MDTCGKESCQANEVDLSILVTMGLKRQLTEESLNTSLANLTKFYVLGITCYFVYAILWTYIRYTLRV